MMKYLFMLLVALTLLSCEQPIPVTPVKATTTATITSAPVVVPEKVLGPEYDAFLGDFEHIDSRGFRVLVSFLGEDKCMAVCITANAKPYFNYDFVLHNSTITTGDGKNPLIWWFKCKDYPYRWDDADTLIVTDPVNNRVLTLRRR